MAETKKLSKKCNLYKITETVFGAEHPHAEIDEITVRGDGAVKVFATLGQSRFWWAMDAVECLRTHIELIAIGRYSKDT